MLGGAGMQPAPRVRLGALRDVHPGVGITSYFGLIAPVGTSGTLLHRITAGGREVLHGRVMAPRLLDFCMVPVGSSPEDYAA